MPRIRLTAQEVSSAEHLQSVLDSLSTIHSAQMQLKDQQLERAGALDESARSARPFIEGVKEVAQPFIDEFIVPIQKAKMASRAPLPPPIPPPIVTPPSSEVGAPTTPARRPAPAGTETPETVYHDAMESSQVGVEAYASIINILGESSAQRMTRDSTLLSIDPKTGMLQGNRVAFQPSTNTVIVRTASEPLTRGITRLLTNTSAIIDLYRNDITKDDFQAYERLLSKPIKEAPNSAKKSMLLQLKSQLGAGQNGKGSMRRGRKTPMTQSAKIDLETGQFGTGRIDLNEFHKGNLRLMDGKGRMLLHQPMSSGLKHLLTRHATLKQASNGLYLPGDVKQYHEVASIVGVQPPKTDTRNRLLRPEGTVAFLPDDPKVLTNRLTVLEGMSEAGDTSGALVSEASAILDRLLRLHEITKADHERRVRALLR